MGWRVKSRDPFHLSPGIIKITKLKMEFDDDCQMLRPHLLWILPIVVVFGGSINKWLMARNGWRWCRRSFKLEFLHGKGRILSSSFNQGLILSKRRRLPAIQISPFAHVWFTPFQTRRFWLDMESDQFLKCSRPLTPSFWRGHGEKIEENPHTFSKSELLVG